jgi:serine O-acetyltransferase
MKSNALSRCRTARVQAQQARDALPGVVDELVYSCRSADLFNHVGPEPIPSREASVELIERIRRLLFPGYFTGSRLDDLNLPYTVGQETTALFELLARQITLAIRHECLRYNRRCSQCEERGQQETLAFLARLPRLRQTLATDVRAAYQGDPAAKSYDEIIFCYPGLYAVTVYRIAHQLHQQGVAVIPRIMAEHAHSVTGIDIHPGAEIGEWFFIDHGTGVVVGETTTIGVRVRIYQGVTLGALSLRTDEVEALRTQKRHPTIEDDVTIYAGATILGGETVIGARSVIGGNVWITESVPPDTDVFLNKPDLVVRRRERNDQPAVRGVARRRITREGFIGRLAAARRARDGRPRGHGGRGESKIEQ